MRIDSRQPNRSRRRLWLLAAGAAVLAIAAGIVLRNQVNVYSSPDGLLPAEEPQDAAVQQRRALFDALQPVALANCRLERFGEPHDGGYLMCGNLLDDVQSGYSYGISGYDKWGCDVSSRLHVPVHQYDCFDTTRPACSGGRTVFHEECVASRPRAADGRVFETIAHQLAKNGDSSKRIVLKMDVEGAEWDSLLSVPNEILQRVDQLVVEFHWKHDGNLHWYGAEKYIRVVDRLKQFFQVAHIHYNNSACIDGLAPFPTWAFEVLFVSKRLARVDRSRKAGGPHPLDARNDPLLPDCQPAVR